MAKKYQKKKKAQMEAGMRKVLVVMPAYNQGHLIQKALESMLQQEFRDFHLTVVDDGSDDDTFEQAASMMDRFLEEGISYAVFANEHINASGALNWGFAQSEWVAPQYETWVSSDNIYYSEFLKVLVETLDRHGKFHFAYSGFDVIDGEDKIIGTVTKRRPYDKKRLISSYEQGMCYLWRKDLRVKAGLWFDERLQCEDYNMTLRMSEFGDFVYIDEVLGAFRMHQAARGTRDIEKHSLEAKRLYLLWKEGHEEGIPQTYLLKRALEALKEAEQ